MRINLNGKVEGSYTTKKAAFEAAVGPASNAKKGYAVTLSVDASAPNEPALGSS